MTDDIASFVTGLPNAAFFTVSTDPAMDEWQTVAAEVDIDLPGEPVDDEPPLLDNDPVPNDQPIDGEAQ